MAKSSHRRIEEAWGFSFPDDLDQVFRVARSLDRRAPLTAFQDTIGVRLEGPFVVLAGGEPEKNLGRWTSDPPEFFTVASGDTDGLHWGYVFHEPGKTPGLAAHFYSRDGYPITVDGTLFGSLRTWLIDVRRERAEEHAAIVKIGERDRDLEKRIAAIDKQLEAFDAARVRSARPRAPKPVAPTLDGLGIVCSKRHWAPPGLTDARLASKLRDANERPKLIERARALLAQGKPGGALKIARDLFAASPEKELGPLVLLLLETYLALDRPLLARAIAPLAPAQKARKTSKPARPGPLRSCSTLADALEDPGSVESLQITYHSSDQTPPRPEHLRAMKRLKTLVLRGVTVDDLPIDKLPVEHLELFEVRLKRFPAALHKLPELTDLTLNIKLGSGALPDELRYPKLERAELAHVGLETVPAFILKAKRLYNLSLYYNRVSEVPAALGALSELRYLNLQDNRIKELPDVFQRLTKLSSLSLENNRLSTLPESIGALRKTLKTLFIGKNPLTKSAAERARLKALLPKTKIHWT
ncbi:MAG: DUF2228 domain-containing protein [Polyangiaceae bacterium]